VFTAIEAERSAGTQPTVLGGGGTDDAGRFDQLCWCIGTKGSMVDSAVERMRRLR
jgi:hypothetical protein